MKNLWTNHYQALCNKLRSLPFEIVNPPEQENRDLSPQTPSTVKIPKITLQQILEFSPNPSLTRKIFYAADLEFEEARVLGRFQEYLLIHDLQLPDWVFQHDFLALKCLNACKRSFRKTYERILMILTHSNFIKSLQRRDYVDILVLII